MKNTTCAMLAALLVIAGMVGLYFKIEYSGWVLAIGLICACDV